MLFLHEYIVRKHEYGLLFRKGDFQRFLAPGKYRFLGRRKHLDVETWDLSAPAFPHRLTEFFVKRYPQDVERLFTQVETGSDEAAAIFHDGRLRELVSPEQRVLFWKGVIDVSVEKIDLSNDVRVAPKFLKSILGEDNETLKHSIVVREVPEGHTGLLYVDGRLTDELDPGVHAFWGFYRGISVEPIDLRVRNLEVGGQEILTRDKVELRINVSAIYRFADAGKATRAVRDPRDYLYKEVQHGLRAAVGTRTLDALLEDKRAIDRNVFEHVHDKFAEIGIEVLSIGVKDIILPGEMKALLSKVVEAERAAQANVIRRREETNATRSLLNTAKVIEDNPAALRLKELEALEKITEKIGNISVYGGLDSVLNELVRIKQ